MRDKFWLIQRGKFRDNLKTATSFLGGTGNHLIDPDYMGAAEFEWGAIPAAFTRIMVQWDQYKLRDTGLRTVRDVPLYIFCREDCFDQIVEEIKVYIAEPYHLKEYSNLSQHFKESTTRFDRYALSTNFWWCIDYVQYKQDAQHIGDWIAFLGATDRLKAFQRVIQDEHDNWFTKLPKEDIDRRIFEAWRR